MPYVEDTWTYLSLKNEEKQERTEKGKFEVLGKCRRCHMLCIDQRTAEKRQEPFVTLAKTRRSEGKVWFGVHLALSGKQSKIWVKVGDEIVAS